MRKVLMILLGVGLLGMLAGCGSSGTSVPPNPSTGNNAGFTNASLSGTYVLTFNGYNGANNYSYAGAGVITADGSGKITGGTRDTVYDNGGQTLKESVTGTYAINQDGRGQLLLNGSIYRLVMVSNSDAKLMEFSSSSDTVGELQLQSTPATTLASLPYVFSINGGDATANQNPYAAIGSLTMGAGGTVNAIVDENDAGVVNQQLVASGNYSIGTTGRGTLTYGTHNFVIYEVSSSRIEMISTDKNNFLYGHAREQSVVSAPTGDQVFLLSGYDSNGYSIVEAGRMTLDGAGGINSGMEDYNDNGNYVNIGSGGGFNGSYSVSGGRWTASIGTISTSLIGWQISPTLAEVLVNNSALLETGEMRAQTTNLTNASISGNYAQTFTGVQPSVGDVEITGNYLADGNGNLSGTYDSQTPSGDFTDNAGTGTYSMQANGRNTGSIAGVTVVMYSADADTVFLISSDPTRVYQGQMLKQ